MVKLSKIFIFASFSLSIAGTRRRSSDDDLDEPSSSLSMSSSEYPLSLAFFSLQHDSRITASSREISPSFSTARACRSRADLQEQSHGA